jgi:NitT/TauT family transport system substrate-binding protein
MSKAKRGLFVALSVMFIAVFVLASVSHQPVTASTAPDQADGEALQLTTVRVGLVPVMIFAPVFVADAKGYFADENLEVEILRNPGGSEPLAPLATGELEVVLGGAGTGLFNYAARNLELNGDPGFRIVSGGHAEAEPMTSPLVVSKARFDNGEITSVADLRGGRVAINAPGAATEYWMAQALASEGLTWEDVELVAVAFPDVAASLNSPSADRVDAAILGEPLVSFAEAEGLVVRLSDDFIDGFQATFLYMSVDFIENNREAAVGFVRAYVRAARDLASAEAWQSDEIATILETYTNVPAEVNRNASRPLYPLNGEINVADLETLQAYFLEKGDLSYTEPLDVTMMLDTSLSEEVIADLGEYEMDEDMDDDTSDDDADNGDDDDDDDDMDGDEATATEEASD